MCFAGGIADTKNPVCKHGANSGSDRTGGEPGTLDPRALKRVRHTLTRIAQMPQHGVSSALFALATLVQGFAADAARKADPSCIAPYHASIAAAKDQQGHE